MVQLNLKIISKNFLYHLKFILISKFWFDLKIKSKQRFDFAYKVVWIDDKFSKPVVLYKGKMHSTNLLKQLIKNIIIGKNSKIAF